MDGHVNRVLPTLVVDPVHRDQEGVQEEGGESEVPRNDVIKRGPLEGDAYSGPDLAVAGNGNQYDDELRGADDAHEDSYHLKTCLI